MQITKTYIKELKNASGECSCSLEELKDIYKGLGRPKGRAVKIRSVFYVSFELTPYVQFKVFDCESKDQLSFIESLHFIDATHKEKSIAQFIWHEFFDGKNWYSKIWRFLSTLLPLVVVNSVIILISTNQNIETTFNGLLTALAFFVAIFSLFTVSHEHLERRKLRLFENGKLAYYFSVDKNLTKLGITAIIICILGIMVTPDEVGKFWNDDCNYNYLDWLILILINVAVFNTFILLRSIIEFYIHRPAEFILGDMKKESLENYKE